MKFSAGLNDHENIRARRHFAEKQTAYDELSPDERRRLMLLNEQLKNLEEQYLPILNATGKALEARVDDPADWMQDFNLEFVLTFYLGEDDPEYEEDDDNILMVIHESAFEYNEPDRRRGFGNTRINHCIPKENHPGEHHCYLFHALVTDCYLDWRDLLRISDLWGDIKIDEQSGRLPVCDRPSKSELSK